MLPDTRPLRRPRRRTLHGWLGAAVLGSLLAALPVSAQEPVVPGAPRPVPQPDIPTQKPTSPDAAFVSEASASSAREIELGKMASMRAVNVRVREFASKMVADHSKAAAELRALSVGKGWTTTKTHEPDADQASLERAKGAEFDRLYMNVMVAAHDDAVRAFDEQARTGMDAELKAWAQKTLPVIRDHRTAAIDVQASLDRAAVK